MVLNSHGKSSLQILTFMPWFSTPMGKALCRYWKILASRASQYFPVLASRGLCHGSFKSSLGTMICYRLPWWDLMACIHLVVLRYIVICLVAPRFGRRNKTFWAMQWNKFHSIAHVENDGLKCWIWPSSVFFVVPSVVYFQAIIITSTSAWNYDL